VSFRLGACIDALAARFGALAHEKGIEFAHLVQHDAHGWIIGDPTAVRRILGNVLDNAFRCTESGEVVLRVRRLEQQRQRVRLLFEVEDTGIGMGAQQLETLFRYAAGADGTGGPESGRPVGGLASARRLIASLGGEIGADSTPGRGTTVWITLPFEMEPAVAEPAPVETLTGLRILAVDDNAANREILAHYLSSWQADHAVADSGRRALTLLRDAARAGRAFDVAVLDMQMPVMDGLTLGRQIKADAQLCNTRLLMLSSLEPSAESLRAAGFRFVLNKPLRRSVLYQALRQLRDPGPQGRGRPEAAAP
jgi:CheY-like chemotaxis protein